MNKYKIIAEVEINGSLQFVGTEIELSAEEAASFVEAGQLEIVGATEEATASDTVETTTSETTGTVASEESALSSEGEATA